MFINPIKQITDPKIKCWKDGDDIWLENGYVGKVYNNILIFENFYILMGDYDESFCLKGYNQYDIHKITRDLSYENSMKPMGNELIWERVKR